MPVWYSVNENPKLFVVFLDASGRANEGVLADFLSGGVSLDLIRKGLQKVIAPTGAKYEIAKTSPGEDYIQETDTFDTWFSSSQWPLTTLRYPDSKDFKEFFPTTFMDSMWDILFFWIARMIMMSLYLANDIPFKNVYIHGSIVDAKGQKMSKSKGNTINPIDWVEKYGADALRMGIMVGGNTSAKVSPLSEDKVKGYRNFANKIWNMGRFMEIMEEELKASGKNLLAFEDIADSNRTADDAEILKGLQDTIKEVDLNLTKYRIADAGNAIYHFMWHELADKYIEIAKNREDKDVALGVLRKVYMDCLKLLHPFMPFVTEAIWEELNEKSDVLSVSRWPLK
jgi:valyl-tRNA synthetase